MRAMLEEAVTCSPGSSPDAEDVERAAPLSSVPPSFKVAAVASVAGLRDSHGNIPLDACVPVRTDVDLSDALDWRATVVFLCTDGTSSLRMIASRMEISLPDAIAGCIDLIAQGAVELAQTQTTESEATS
jgi:hypothetical protein